MDRPVFAPLAGDARGDAARAAADPAPHEVVGRFEVFDVLRKAPLPSAQGPARIHTLRCPDWVAVVPVTPDGKIVLVRQHRYGIDASTLETPGGIVDPGETPEEAAARELLEETGHAAPRLEPLGWIHPNPALQGNRCFLFAARGAVPVAAPQPDEGERCEVVLLAAEDLASAVRRGDVTHALALVALARALARVEPPWGR